MSTARVCVAMLTYRRPDDLGPSITAVVEQLDDLAGRPSARLLVVDNDPEASAAEVVRGWGDERVDYVHEPRPGIAAGRNRAIEESDQDDVLVFIDDDERPDPGWLLTLLEVHRSEQQLGVVGPVVSSFDGPLDPWIEAGGFFRRRALTTGSLVDVVATNNLLLDVGTLRRSGLRFDESFGLSGGSDTLFSLQAAAQGLRFAWAAEARVVDVVPAARATRSWVLRRAFRSGNSWARASLAASGGRLARVRVRARLLPPSLGRVAVGGVRWSAGVALRSQSARANGLRNLARGSGMFLGLLGYVYQEYKRPAGARS